MVLGDQHDVRPDHPQRPAPLAKQFLPEDVGIPKWPPIPVERIVAVQSLGQVHPQTVNVHLLDEERRAADELLADDLLPVARRPAARSVIDVATVRGCIVGWAALVPVIDILLGRGRIVLPLGPLRAGS